MIVPYKNPSATNFKMIDFGIGAAPPGGSMSALSGSGSNIVTRHQCPGPSGGPHGLSGLAADIA